MPSELRTRASRERAVVVNALTKPVNVLVPAAMIVAGLVLHLVLLAPLALVAYAVLSVMTLFDEDEAKKVMAAGRLPAGEAAQPALVTAEMPEQVAEPLRCAVEEERKIREAIEAAKLPYDEVSVEVGVLMEEMAKVGEKGAMIYAYLTDAQVEDAPRRLQRLRARHQGKGAAAEAHEMAIEALESQVKIRAELSEQFDRCVAELEHLAASLGVIRGQIVRMSVAEDAAIQSDVAGQVRDLRNRVSTLAEGLSQAYDQVDATA